MIAERFENAMITFNFILCVWWSAGEHDVASLAYFTKLGRRVVHSVSFAVLSALTESSLAKQLAKTRNRKMNGRHRGCSRWLSSQLENRTRWWDITVLWYRPLQESVECNDPQALHSRENSARSRLLAFHLRAMDALHPMDLVQPTTSIPFVASYQVCHRLQSSRMTHNKEIQWKDLLCGLVMSRYAFKKTRLMHVSLQSNAVTKQQCWMSLPYHCSLLSWRNCVSYKCPATKVPCVLVLLFWFGTTSEDARKNMKTISSNIWLGLEQNIPNCLCGKMPVCVFQCEDGHDSASSDLHTLSVHQLNFPLRTKDCWFHTIGTT
jgi:hypothetical protein